MHNVSNDAIVSNGRAVYWRCMNDRVVLNAGSSTNLDESVVSAQYGACPNGGLATDFYRSNDHGIRVDECRFVNDGNTIAKCVDCHA
jgi:hypothetical protein